MDIFIRNYFNRMFLVMDAMKQTRALIDNSDCDPNSIVKIRNKMAVVSKHIILLEEVSRGHTLAHPGADTHTRPTS